MGDEHENVRVLLKRFYTLQEERVATYNSFELAFQTYLNTAPNYQFEIYRQRVHEITEIFKRISSDVLVIIESFKNQLGQNQLAHHLENIQDAEANKLKQTAAHQIARQNRLDHPDDDSFLQETWQLEIRLRESRDTINECLEELKYDSEDVYS